MPTHRWVWMQYHGTHAETSCEYQLRHVMKKQFLCGIHQLDDPALLEWAGGRQNHEFQAKPGDLADKPVQRRTLSYTSVGWPPPAPEGGYRHLSWMYYNFAPREVPNPSLIDIAAMLFRNDPDVKLLVFAQYAHQSVKDLVEWLQSYHRQNYALAYRKFSNLVYSEEGGLHVPTEDWLLEHADIRLIHFGCASHYPLFDEFLRKHDISRGGYYDIGSRMSAREIELVVDLADEALESLLGTVGSPDGVMGNA